MLNSPGIYICASYRNPQLYITHWPVAVILNILIINQDNQLISNYSFLSTLMHAYYLFYGFKVTPEQLRP